VAVNKTSVLATNIERASTENSTARVDMLTPSGNGALQYILWGGIQQPTSVFRPAVRAILPHEIQWVTYIKYYREYEERQTKAKYQKLRKTQNIQWA
jgi:hypothetical protein